MKNMVSGLVVVGIIVFIVILNSTPYDPCPEKAVPAQEQESIMIPNYGG